MKKTLHFRHGLAAMTATIVMLFAQLLATNAHTSGISPATAGDETSSYGINIIGVPVTPENCNDLSVIDGVSGTVKYDPTTKTLTLENATIDTGDNTGDNAQGIFNSEVPDLNIQVNGTNKITSHSSAVTISQTTTISGTGTLNATSTDNCGIYVFNSALTIEDCTVSAIGKWGIAGPGYNNRAEFVIRNAIVTAKGSDGSICDISKFTLNNVAITSPTGAAYDSSLQGVALNGKVVTDIVAILPLTYGIKIAGAQVTHENYNNLSVINGVSGTVRFDPFTKTLTLINATIDAGSRGYAIDNLNPDLKIQVIGTNVVKSSQAAIVLHKPITIKGDGTLNVTSTVDCGIYINNSSLTIENCTVNTTGIWGISGNTNSTRDIVTIRDATVTAQGSSGSICDIVKLTLDDVVITSPEGAAFDNTKKCVTLNGTMVTDKISILPSKCRIAIAGTPVTLDNCNDLSGIDGVSGTIYYDPITKTLTLENATIDAGNRAPAIRHAIRDLTILLKGSNNIMGTGSTPTLEISTSTTIKGVGSLNIASANECGIYITSSTLTIEDCTMNITARWGIAGPTGGNPRENVVIRNAAVSAQGSDGSICDINRLTLDRVTITSPAGAAFDSSLKCVALNGTKVTDRVVIDAISYGLQIAGVDITSKNYDKINTIDGVSGTVYYDPLTNTLTLNNATIDAGDKGRAISNNGVSNLNIQVTGTNNLKSSTDAAIIILKPTTIKGDGTLNTASTTDCGLFITSSPLTIEDCTVNATGLWGIAGSTSSSLERGVTIRNATVSAQGSYGSICDINRLTLDNVTILSPTGAAYDSSLKCVARNGTMVTDKVVIGAISYGLQIAGVDITSANYDKINTIEGVSGTVDYDPRTNTLILNNATIDANANQGIYYNATPDFTIEVFGTNNIKSSRAAIFLLKPTTIKGDGTLNTTSADGCGIYVIKSALTIKDCTVNAIGNWGIAGQSGATNETVTIRNATVTAQGKDGSICDIANLTLLETAILSPDGAAYDSSQKCVALNGKRVTDKVVIHPFTCGIEIAGTPVTLDNCNDLSVIDGVSGTVKYDPVTKTLLLNKAQINLSGHIPGIHNKDVSDLTIKVIDNTNKITVGYKAGIVINKPTKIKGYAGGILKITSIGDCGIYMPNSPLTIEDCQVSAEGRYGIAGYDGSNSEILTIRSAGVAAEGRDGTICNIKNLVLGQGCSIRPMGVTYDSILQCMAYNGTPYKDRVVITVETYDIYIAGVRITGGNYDRINTIEGVSGTVTYDPTTKTLKLDNATIQGNNDITYQAIEHAIPNLTILVTGTNNITGSENGILITQPTTIKGEGVLNITPTSSTPFTRAITLRLANLTIEDCTVNFTGRIGIQSDRFSTSDPEDTNILTIKNAIVTGNCDLAAIGLLRDLILSGSTFTSPVYATYNYSMGGVTSEGKPVKNLVIQPTTLYDVVLDWHGENKADIIKVLTDEYGYSILAAQDIVESTPAIVGKRMQKLDAIKMRDALMAAGGIHSSATIHPEGTWTSINSTETVVPTHRPGIYNMQGVKMTRDWDTLPSGLYIVDGVKRMKK